MNTYGLPYHHRSSLLIACAGFALLLSACQPETVPPSLPTAQPTAIILHTQPAPAMLLPAEQPTEAQATQPSSVAAGEITLDLSGLAQEQTVETIAARPAGEGEPYWEAAPEYRRVTLEGYPVTGHLIKPQIFVYPVTELAGFNEVAGQIAADLHTLLQERQPVERMPYLPLYNAMQVMHTQSQYLDFKNGEGVRFLTQFVQAPIPINNYELIYTFQGLTSDGNYYVAAVLPVTHPELPATQQFSQQQISELSDFPAYLAKTSAWLEQQPGSSFTPNRGMLDALIQSIEVK